MEISTLGGTDIKKIGHYSIENPCSVYDEEAMTALELAGRTAAKVNECVDKVNNADDYLHRNLNTTVKNEINKMANNGTLENELLRAVSSGKVDKGGHAQVTYEMLAQDVKAAMTKDAIPVVGVDAVNTDNIIDRAVSVAKVGNAVMTPHITMTRYTGDPETVVFDIDPDAKTAHTVAGGNYNFYVGSRYIAVDFDTVSYDLSDLADGFTRCYVYYNQTTNVIVFQASKSDVPASYVFLGILVTNGPKASTLCIPFSVKGSYLYYPVNPGREWATVLYYPKHYYNKTLPYVDYANKRIVFPSVNYLYVLNGEQFFNIGPNHVEYGYENGDYVVYLQSGYNFIVGGKYGIKAVDNNEYKSMLSSTKPDEYYVLGTVQTNSHHASLNFDFVDGSGSLSILGDSISASAADIPEGNAAYYNDVDKEQMWWNMVMRRCGLYKNTVQAWSGRRVSRGTSSTPTGVDHADQLDNGTDPDNIIIYLGTNDFRNGAALGTYDGRGPIPTDDTTFREAYAMMLDKVLRTYPKAKVYACTLPASERNDAETGLPEKNKNGVYLFEYNEAIRELATRLHVEVIDLATCTLNHHNGQYFMHDYSDSFEGSFTHPNTEGHRIIANKVAAAVSGSRNYNGYHG